MFVYDDINGYLLIGLLFQCIEKEKDWRITNIAQNQNPIIRYSMILSIKTWDVFGWSDIFFLQLCYIFFH